MDLALPEIPGFRKFYEKCFAKYLAYWDDFQDEE